MGEIISLHIHIEILLSFNVHTILMTEAGNSLAQVFEVLSHHTFHF